MAETKTDRLAKAEESLVGLNGYDPVVHHHALLLVIEEIRELRKEVEASRVEDAPGYDEIVGKDLTP